MKEIFLSILATQEVSNLIFVRELIPSSIENSILFLFLSFIIGVIYEQIKKNGFILFTLFALASSLFIFELSHYFVNDSIRYIGFCYISFYLFVITFLNFFYLKRKSFSFEESIKLFFHNPIKSPLAFVSYFCFIISLFLPLVIDLHKLINMGIVYILPVIGVLILLIKEKEKLKKYP